MDRRDFLIGATTGLATIALAKTSGASHPSGGGHAGHAQPVDVTKLREATLACDAAAADCIRHCLASIAEGDVSLADCLSSVLKTQAVTQATYSVISSELTPDAPARQLVAACAEFCEACSAACQPHAKKHSSCKACMEACDHCAQACEALAA